MDPITILLVAAPVITVAGLFLSWDQPFFQHRPFRIALGACFLLLTAISAFGILASFELSGADGLAWRLRYLVLGSFTLAASLYFFIKRPVLHHQSH